MSRLGRVLSVCVRPERIDSPWLWEITAESEPTGPTNGGFGILAHGCQSTSSPSAVLGLPAVDVVLCVLSFCGFSAAVQVMHACRGWYHTLTWCIPEAQARQGLQMFPRALPNEGSVRLNSNNKDVIPLDCKPWFLNHVDYFLPVRIYPDTPNIKFVPILQVVAVRISHIQNRDHRTAVSTVVAHTASTQVFIKRVRVQHSTSEGTGRYKSSDHYALGLVGGPPTHFVDILPEDLPQNRRSDRVLRFSYIVVARAQGFREGRAVLTPLPSNLEEGLWQPLAALLGCTEVSSDALEFWVSATTGGHWNSRFPTEVSGADPDLLPGVMFYEARPSVFIFWEDVQPPWVKVVRKWLLTPLLHLDTSFTRGLDEYVLPSPRSRILVS